MDGLKEKTILKWMIGGYHYFRKHPHGTWQDTPKGRGKKSSEPNHHQLRFKLLIYLHRKPSFTCSVVFFCGVEPAGAPFVGFFEAKCEMRFLGFEKKLWNFPGRRVTEKQPATFVWELRGGLVSFSKIMWICRRWLFIYSLCLSVSIYCRLEKWNTN